MSHRSPSSRLARCAVAVAAALAGGTVLAQPSGLSPVHGTASVHQSGATTTVTTVNGVGTRHSALDWRAFSVPGGTTVHFAQPDAASLSINRVTGKDPSRIAGTLSSNGRLVLVNPAGIAVAPGAVIDTAGFTASTLGMTRADAIAGRLRFELGEDKGGRDDDDEGKGKGKAGKMEFDGRVIARNGDVVLIGTDIHVGAKAVIEARGGDVVLAAGRRVELTGRGLEGIRMELKAPEDKAFNLGTLQGDSVGIFAGHLKHSGMVRAVSATTVGGKVVLQATDHADIDGAITAATADRGGTVHITGKKVTLKAATHIDASHAAGGGEILVGGGSRGQDTRLANARDVHVHKGAVLQADATSSGPGGTVIVWSDDKLDFDGAALARGASGGARGRVEIDARGRVKFGGRVDVSSSAGTPPPATEMADGGTPGSDLEKSGESGPAPEPLPYVPRQGQPQGVQSAMAKPESENVSYMAASAALLAPLSSTPQDPYKRREVADDGVQCVTR